MVRMQVIAREIEEDREREMVAKKRGARARARQDMTGRIVGRLRT